MSIQNAGKTIRDAGISPVTFQSLMTRAGAPCEIYPMFGDRTELCQAICQ